MSILNFGYSNVKQPPLLTDNQYIYFVSNARAIIDWDRIPKSNLVVEQG